MVARYQQAGIDGLQKRPYKGADFVEKCKIVCEYAEKGVSLHRVSAKYHVAQCTISKWARIYREGGYDALRDIKPQGKGRKGNCLDISVMENFFGLMKNELLYNNRWESIDDFKVALKEYIRYYNNERIKLKLKMSPVQYRTHFQNQVK